MEAVVVAPQTEGEEATVAPQPEGEEVVLAGRHAISLKAEAEGNAVEIPVVSFLLEAEVSTATLVMEIIVLTS